MRESPPQNRRSSPSVANLLSIFILTFLFLLSPSNSRAALPPGVVAYYPFDGSSLDASGYSTHLATASGIPQFTDRDGPFGGALYLDGATTLGTLSGTFPSGVPTGAKPYTVACFIKAAPDASANGGWIGYGLNGGAGLANNFRMSGYSGVWNYWWNLDLGAAVPNGGSFTDAWHSVVGTWDGTTRNLYIDGLLQAADHPAPPNIGTTSFVVGKTLNDANLKGWLAELLIANRAFSLAEVQDYHTFGGLGAQSNVLITTQPRNLALPVGQSGFFSVIARGAPPLQYQWYHGTSPIPGALGATLPVTNLSNADLGNYYVIVSNAFSRETSAIATLSSFNDLLAYEGFNYAAAASLAGQSGGLGWSGPWTNVNGANATISSGSLGAASNAPPMFDSRSSGNSARLTFPGRSARALDCSAAGNLGTGGYLDPNGHIGADGKTLYLSFVQQPGDVASVYELELHRGDLTEAGRIAGIGNAFNSTTVNFRAPNATHSPMGWGATNASFYVVRIDFRAGNDDVVVYRNPKGYSEADNEPVLTLAGVADLSFDAITLAASNGVSVTHDELRLGASWSDVLGGPPVFVLQPVSQDLCTGQAALFTALAQSAQPVAYQWYRDPNILLARQTNTTLSLPNLGPSDAGTYWVVASNTLGAVTSSVASLTVEAIRVAVSSGGHVVGSGGSLLIDASANGAPPLSLQWFRDGTALAGQTNGTFSKDAATVFDAGLYTLVASNPYGSATSAVITVCADLGGLLAYEGFDYPTAVGGLPGQNGGLGWSGPWSNIGGPAATIFPGSLLAATNGPASFDSHAAGGGTDQPNNSRSGRFLDCSPTGPFAARGLVNGDGNIGADGHTLYLSFLQQPDGTSLFYEFELHRGDLGDPGRISGIGNDLGNASTVNLRTGSAQTPIGPGTTNVNFYVVRIDYQPGNDDVRVYMNPTSVTEPSTPSLTLLAAGDLSLNGLSFGAYVNGRSVKHDEIRLGLTWADVVGDSVSALQMLQRTNSQSTLLLAASPYYSYQLEAAPNVTGPWTNVARLAAPLTGVGQFVETNTPDPQRFYRALTQPSISATGNDLVLADFEGATYGSWITTGTAFGSGPAPGTLPSQQTVSGYLGSGLVNSFAGGDASTGSLTSPPFEITAPYLSFFIGGGNHPGQTCLNLLVDGVVVFSATGADSETLAPVQWDVSAYLGKMASLQIVDTATGGWGHILLDQIVLSDQRFIEIANNTTRTIQVTNSFLNFPVKTGAPMRRVSLSVGGQTVRQFDIELADAQPDFWVFLDLTPFLGQTATITVNQLPANSGVLLAVHQANTITGATNLYQESLRPQFHFSARRGWLNDANGVFYYQGEYHLYYQHNPYGWNWGNMHWGHAVSSNLVEWTELPIGIYPRQYGDWVFSGSAVVDEHNTSGFQVGPQPPIVAAYTSTGRGECIAYSNDRGRTFTDFTLDPVVAHNGRDPHLLWYAPSNYWVMAVYDITGADGIAFYSSPDLRQWTYRSRVNGFFECPDLFPLPVDGQPANTKWVLSDASSGYMLGQFDGAVFTPETAKLPGNNGAAFYAAQTFTQMPPGDARCVRIGWGQISMPGMPFNQMMYFPTKLSLRTLPAGVRLCSQPVAEIAQLHSNQYAWTNLALNPSANPLAGIRGTLFDVKAQFSPAAAQTVTFTFQGLTVTYNTVAQTISCNGITNPLPPSGGSVQLQILVDRDSIEIFGNNGQLYMPLPARNPVSNSQLSLTCVGGTATFDSLIVSKLKSAWPQP